MIKRALWGLVATLASGCPESPPEPDPCTVSPPPPAPERIVIEDCATIVDVASLSPPPVRPECPAPEPPVTSLCPNGGAGPEGLVQSQAELEAYRGCTSVDGDLTITGSVCSLAPLSSLEAVTGDLVLGVAEDGDPGLTFVDLDGLGALRTVGGDLVIRGLPALASLDGLDALEQVGFDFELFQLPGLVHLGGASSLAAVGGDVNVSFNPALVLVDGFDSLASIGAGLRFGHDASLLCVDGFSSLAASVEIELENGPLQAAPGIAAVLIAGAPTLKVIDMPSFDLFTLPRLERLGGLDIVGPPPRGTDLRAFSDLVTLGLLRIRGSNLESLGGLEGLVSLGELDLHGNPELDDVSALAGVVELRTLRLRDQVTYDLACALPGVVEIAELTIGRTSFEVIPWPRGLRRIGNLLIVENESLDDLGDPELTLGDGAIIDNSSITNDEVIAWLAARTVEGVVKYGNNAGVAVDPCPWLDDGVCDFFCAQDSAADCPPID